MQIEYQTLTVGPIATNCYMLYLKDRSDCVIVDPGGDADRIIRMLGGRRIAAVLLTHGHFDHVLALPDLLTSGLMDADTPVCIHTLDAPMLADPTLNVSRSFLFQGLTFPAANRTVQDGDTFEAGGMPFRVMHTPGHTAGSVCYVCAEKLLLSGDTLMALGCGRCDLPTGNEQEMVRSLQKLRPLLSTCTLLGGHG
ncbi:MAG: MBL fold metallo-hydrolase [Clostridia bacterium]|nr:MBL fold metallo-hydrolase [Clostridia bacterium]